MALDRAHLTANLHSFYGFEDKVVLCVGAGRGQLLDPNFVTRETVLIDRDEKALAEMNTPSPTNGTQGRGRTVVADFEDINIPGDVVYFEFCLHEMDDPKQAIFHARTLAPDVVIFEHSPSSDWVFYEGKKKGYVGAPKRLPTSPSTAVYTFMLNKLSRITLNSLPNLARRVIWPSSEHPVFPVPRTS